jgi:hypothetical protein
VGTAEIDDAEDEAGVVVAVWLAAASLLARAEVRQRATAFLSGGAVAEVGGAEEAAGVAAGLLTGVVNEGAADRLA